MVKKTDRPPPVWVASGGEGLLRRRFLAQVMGTQKEAGWDVVEVDGANPRAVQDVLDGDMFMPVRTLAVVENPEKIDLTLLERHLGSKDYTTTLLLHIEGEPDGRTKFGKFVKASLGVVHRNFPLPTEWKAGEVASAFVQEEAKRYGQSFPAALATALTQRSGTDLGILSFEVDKIAILANLDGVSVIEAKHVARAMAPIAEASVLPITDALAMRQAKKLGKALADLKRTSRSDQTMRICRLVGSSVTKWLQAVYLDSLPPRAAAEELGVHPWYFEHKILPAAKRWGKVGILGLVHDLAASERAVFNGALNPWVVLTSRLLFACAGGTDGPQRTLVVVGPPPVLDPPVIEPVEAQEMPDYASMIPDFVAADIGAVDVATRACTINSQKDNPGQELLIRRGIVKPAMPVAKPVRARGGDEDVLEGLFGSGAVFDPAEDEVVLELFGSDTVFDPAGDEDDDDLLAEFYRA